MFNKDSNKQISYTNCHQIKLWKCADTFLSDFNNDVEAAPDSNDDDDYKDLDDYDYDDH